MIVIEVLDHLGRVKEHHKLTDRHITVGRSYNNDVVLNDPYVCAHHLDLELGDDESLKVRDLNSVNGLYTHGRKKKVDTLELKPDQSLSIGRSSLRYRRLNHEVPPARQDRLRFELLNTMLNSHGVQWGGFLLLGLLIYLLAYLDTFGEFKPFDPLKTHLLPMAMMIFLWAGFWSVLSRITMHSFYFTAHSIIATTMILLTLLFEGYLAPTLRFAFNADLSIDLLTPVVTFVIMVMAFYAHLRFCSSQSPRRLTVTAVTLSAVLLVLTYLDEMPDSDHFSNYPDYPTVMMPPSYQLVPEVPLETFLERSETIKTELLQRAREED